MKNDFPDTQYTMTYIVYEPLTNWQRQIVIGTILGGSSIIKPKTARSCYLSMRGTNPKWLECKAQEFPNLRSQNPYFTSGRYYRWHSCCSPCLNEFRETFYKDGKKCISMDILNELRNIGLAVWFLDSGSMEKDRSCFHTTSYKKEGTDIISQYLSEVGMDNEIVKKGNGFRVILDDKSTRKLIGVIGEIIPPFMYA